jgi:hypothetical protein
MTRRLWAINCIAALILPMAIVPAFSADESVRETKSADPPQECKEVVPVKCPGVTRYGAGKAVDMFTDTDFVDALSEIMRDGESVTIAPAGKIKENGLSNRIQERELNHIQQ